MTSKSANILLVDDDETITWTLATALKKREPSLNIYQAHSGMEALGYIKQLKSLDLLITDIHMPQLTGIELLQKLHESKLQTNIIVMTGFGSDALFDQVEQLGAIRYFTKPFDIKELTAVAIEIVKRSEEPESTSGFLGNFGRLKMIDIIQINCLIKQTGLLKVSCAHRLGKVYFKDGEIVHAECSNAIGEDAIYSIMGWGGGRFDVKEQVYPQKPTIFKSWEYLLIEFCRRTDKLKQESNPSNSDK
jgi:CheY-like chemotaxis protein